MAIKFVCETCQKRLQVDDRYAGRKVSCPKCKAVTVAPGERVRSARATVPPAPPKVHDPDPFGFGVRPGGEARPAPKKSALNPGGGSGSSDTTPRAAAPTPRYGRAVARRPSPRAWQGFAAGCGLARWGMWVEFVGFAVGVAVLLSVLADASDLAALRGPGAPAGLFLAFGSIYLGAAAGGALACVGRARQAKAPAGTGAKGPLVAAFLFALLRACAVLGSLVLLVLAYTQDGDGSRRSSGDHFQVALEVWLLGLLLGGVADQAVLPAAAIAGGALPSPALRERAGGATVLVQVVGGVFAALVAGLYLYDRSASAAPGAGSGGGASPTVVVVLLAALVVLQLLYTLAYSSLYAAAARAVAAARAADAGDDYDDGDE